MEHKIFSYLDKVIDAYREPINLIDGLPFNHRDTLRTIEFYSNDKYLSGNSDGLGREKPFYNVCNYRVTVAKTATDLDVKDIKFEADSLKDSVAAMIINHELYKYLKESNFSQTLNEMGKTRPKYGGLLVKKYEGGGKLDIGVVEWKNADTDPVDIMGGLIIETHWMLPSEMVEKSDVWDSDEVAEAIKAHAKANKNKPARCEVKEITGEVPVAFDPDEEDTEKNMMKYKSMCFYVACVNKKKFLLYKEDIKTIKDKYRYLEWEKIPGRGLGRGVVEEGFEAQVWTNDGMITLKNGMEIATKVVGKTTSQKYGGQNAITGVDHGHMFELEPNATLEFGTLSNSPIPEVERVVELWKQQYNNSVSTYDANTGEAPTAGTPYSQTALLNQVANSPFEYQREVWGIFLNEILNDWILPHLKKRIKKKHYLVSEFGEEELDMIDKTIKARDVNKAIKEMVLAGKTPGQEDVMGMEMGVTEDLKSFGNKREIEIPDSFLDIEGKLTANITGELKNKQAVLQSLAQIGKDIMSTFDPNTGTYRAMQDPFLRRLYGYIIDGSGVPLTSSELKPADTMPVMNQDLSVIAPSEPK